jgi:hypothetical protein
LSFEFRSFEFRSFEFRSLKSCQSSFVRITDLPVRQAGQIKGLTRINFLNQPDGRQGLLGLKDEHGLKKANNKKSVKSTHPSNL